MSSLLSSSEEPRDSSRSRLITMRSQYIAVFFLCITRGMGCRPWVQFWPKFYCCNYYTISNIISYIAVIFRVYSIMTNVVLRDIAPWYIVSIVLWMISRVLMVWSANIIKRPKTLMETTSTQCLHVTHGKNTWNSNDISLGNNLDRWWKDLRN